VLLSDLVYILCPVLTSNTSVRRIGLAAGVMKRLDHVWNQKNVSTSTKIRTYSTCVLSVLLYGSENWTLTQPDWRRLDSFHTRYQRRILRIIWHDYVSNDEVLHRTGLIVASSIVRKDFLTMSQQARSSGPAAKLKTVSGHHPTGSVPEVDLPLHGFIRSTGTQKYR